LRVFHVTGVQTCALPIYAAGGLSRRFSRWPGQVGSLSLLIRPGAESEPGRRKTVSGTFFAGPGKMVSGTIFSGGEEGEPPLCRIRGKPAAPRERRSRPSRLEAAAARPMRTGKELETTAPNPFRKR